MRRYVNLDGKSLLDIEPKLYQGQVVRIDEENYYIRRDGPAESGGSIPYEAWRPIQKGEKPLPTDYWMSAYTGYSDYSGSDVERSNFRLLRAMCESAEKIDFDEKDGIRSVFWIETYGGYDTTDILIRLDTTDTEILETFLALEDYPAIDDEDVSRVLDELIDEDWGSWAAADLRDEIHKATKGRYCLDNATTEDIKAIGWELLNRAEEYPYCEGMGPNIGFPFEKMVAKLDPERDLAKYRVEPSDGPCIQCGKLYYEPDEVQNHFCSEECWRLRIMTGAPIHGGTVPTDSE